MKTIELVDNHIIDCPAFGKVEHGVCARCKKNMLGDFINAENGKQISYCLL